MFPGMENFFINKKLNDSIFISQKVNFFSFPFLLQVNFPPELLHIQPILFTWVLKTLPVNPLTSKVDYHGLGLWTCSWFLNSYATHRPCLEIKTKSFLWTMHLRAFKNLALVLQVFWGYLWSPMFTTSLRNILFITHIYGMYYIYLTYMCISIIFWDPKPILSFCVQNLWNYYHTLYIT